MSDEPITMREYVDMRFEELTQLRNLIDERAELLRAADDRDRTAMNQRLASMNEFRDALRDQTGSFVDRKEMDLRLRPLEAFVQETRGRIAVTVWGIGIFFVVVQIVLRVIWTK